MDDLKKLHGHLTTWLDRYSQANAMAPHVREAAEEVEWQIQTLESRPPEAHNLSTAQIDEQAGIVLQRLGQVLPQMPHYEPSMSLDVSSTTTSANSVTYAHVVKIADLGTPDILKWADQAVLSYHSLQERHHRHDQVRDLLLPGARRFWADSSLRYARTKTRKSEWRTPARPRFTCGLWWMV